MGFILLRFWIGLLSFFLTGCFQRDISHEMEIIPGAVRTGEYLSLLEGHHVAVVANHTSLVGTNHLVDHLLSEGIAVKKIFAPEHGFRGNMDAGAYIEDGLDVRTGLPVISLYGNHRKPDREDLDEIDLVVFDIQDVGVRFYTYFSTMHYVMESCAEHQIPFIVFDRPNPNGQYIDGPVLEDGYRSFVGMHPVPLVHGMTAGEYARMINGEGWLDDSVQCDLKVIPCQNYQHQSWYELPVAPSPNLPELQAIKLYPSLGLFEGTVVSIGRGTDYPFQVFGHPDLRSGDFYFIPEDKPGAAMNPKLEGRKCRGRDLRKYVPADGAFSHINLEWIIWAYQNYEPKEEFFNAYFEKLAGTRKLRRQIESGMPAYVIRESWQEDLRKYNVLREKYLLY